MDLNPEAGPNTSVPGEGIVLWPSGAVECLYLYLSLYTSIHRQRTCVRDGPHRPGETACVGRPHCASSV